MVDDIFSKEAVAWFRYFSGFCLEGLRKTTEMSVKTPVSGKSFETEIFLIRSSSTNRTTAKSFEAVHLAASGGTAVHTQLVLIHRI
jgi:hypothetical protein